MRDVLIYTTAGGEHGLGHVKRMHALALALQQREVTVRFVSPTQADVHAMVTPFAVFPSLMHAPDTGPGHTCLVFDTKAMHDESVYRPWMAGGYPVVRIDHPHATMADLVILPGAHFAYHDVLRLQRAVGAERVVHGAEYVMLAPAVTALSPVPWQERPHRFVYVAGGTDPDGLLSWLSRATERLQRQYHATEHLFPGLNVPWSPELVRAASLVLGLFGVTAYDALYYQTPLLLLGRTAENIAAGTLLAQRYGIPFLGEAGDVASTQIERAVEQAIHGVHLIGIPAPPLLTIDGFGAQRVADLILPLLQKDAS